MVEKLISLNAWTDNNITINAAESEVGTRQVRFELLEDSEHINLANCTVRVYFNDNAEYETCTIENELNGIAYFYLTSSMCEDTGKFDLEVDIVNLDESVTKFTGMSLMVFKSPINNALETSNEYTALEEALGKFNYWNDMFQLKYDEIQITAGEKGDDGISVTNMTVDENNHLIATMSDGSTIDAGEVTGGGSSTYTNLNPVAESIGGIEVGTTFSGKTMQEMFDSLLYPYQYPAFSSFDIDGQSSILEIGDSILANRTFNWATINDDNIKNNTITIKDMNTGLDLATNLVNDGSQALTMDEIRRTNIGSNTFRIVAENTKNITFQKDYIVSWYPAIFYGESTNGELTETDIEILRVKQLKNEVSGIYSMSEGGYKYWIFPTNITQPTRIYDKSTNLDIALALTYTVNVTNEFNVVLSYTVYRSLNVLGGSITAVVE